MDEYEKMLEEAYKNVKQTSSTGERFETPKIEGSFEGRKTILTNFFQIANQLRREPEHLLKFLTKELATQAVKEQDKIILNKKVSSKIINPKIEQYVKDFVLCKECKKPDTQIVKDERQTYLHCLACGAKHPINAKI
jgi:translation initiation factor 2 subunit 2